MNSIYDEWLSSCNDLRIAKAKELSLRNKICELHLVGKLEGSKTVRVDGFAITPTAKLTRSLDKEVLDSIWADLSEKERECIQYKPAIVLAKYKKIEETNSKLTEAVTIRPAQSSLKIIMEDIA